MDSDSLAAWRKAGIVVGPSSSLIPPDLFAAIQAEAHRVQTSRFAKLQAQLEARDRPEAKTFLRQWLGRYPRYDAQSVWAQAAKVLTPIASAYLGQPALLRFYNLWETRPTTGAPSRSQLWHRDREDRVIAKAFLYLSEVTADAGPLTYAPGTHAYGPCYGQHPTLFREAGSGWERATDDAMAALVPAQDWQIATGPIGTLVLADTAGYHKGGYGSTSRLLALWEWTTAQATVGGHFDALGPQP